MKTNLLERLIEARENLSQLKAVQCRMAHERVLIDPNSKLPIAGIAPEMEFQRRDLCAPATRNTNLSCSHSMARYPIKDALDVLEEIGEYENWRSEFNNINTAIHTLDHEKGDAEKYSAQIIKRLSETKEIEYLIEEQILTNAQIADIEHRHSQYAAQIEILKIKILVVLNSAIQSEKKIKRKPPKAAGFLS